MRKFIFIFSIVLILIIIILLNFRLLIFNTGYYHKEFNKHLIYSKFESKNELENNLNNLFNYFKNKEELNNDFFNEKERLHLIDVKKLINKLIFVLYLGSILLILFFIIYRNKNYIINSLISGSLATIIMILFLFLIASINFSWTFLNFHYMAFSNDYWQLESTSNLIKMFPEEFFYDITTKILFNSLILSLIILIISYKIKSKQHI